MTPDQKVQVCKRLLFVGKGDLWTEVGPGAALRARRGLADQPPAERLVLATVLDLWDGTGGLRLGELVDLLRLGPASEEVASALFAIAHGPSAVHIWLEARRYSEER